MRGVLLWIGVIDSFVYEPKSSLEGDANIYDVLEHLILHQICKLAERYVKIHTVRQLPPGYTHKVAQEHKLFLLRSIIIYAILLLHLLS